MIFKLEFGSGWTDSDQQDELYILLSSMQLEPYPVDMSK